MLTKPAGPFASDGEIASRMEQWGDSLAARVAELEAVALFALYNHQGSCSRVGQPIRKRLGIGRFDRLTPDQVEKAEAIADAAGMGHE